MGLNIRYVDKNIFEASEKFILHGVNAQGVIGRGLMQEVMNKYPLAMEQYSELDNYSLGKLQVVHCGDKTVINAIVDPTYGTDKVRYVNYEAVALAMQNLEEILYGQRVAMPLIGLGYSHGDWRVISAIIESELKTVTPVVYIKKGEYSTS